MDQKSLLQSVLLYRKLLSLIKTPQPEDDLIRVIIDSIHEQYPTYRAAFSNVGADGRVLFHYSRQPPSMLSTAGRTLDISCAPDLLKALLGREVVAASDIRKDPRFLPVSGLIHSSMGSVAQVLIPFEEDGGKVSMISLVGCEPTSWERGTIALLTEMAGLVHVMMREARTHAKLRDNETIFQQFAGSVDAVFWLSDIAKQEMLYVSPAYERVWGRSMRSLYEQPLSFLDAIHPEDRARVAEAVSRQAEKRYEEVYRLIRPDGEIRWVRDRGFRVRDGGDRITRVAGLAEDITELHLAQERLESTQAQVVSKAKFAALGEMASGIAHEINNPLAVIHGICVQLQEVLGKEPTTKPMVQDGLKSMEKMANRIAGIVKGLRTFSRETDGDPMLPADLSAIVQETTALFDTKLRSVNVDFTLSLPEERVGILCRSSEVSQVLVNLMSNAFDAVAGVSGPRVQVRVIRQDTHARIEVEDSGPGVPRALRERVFQPFFTTKEVGRGTGLGLSISKGIAEAHGGRLFLDDNFRGTCFVVEFPLERV